MLGNFLKTFQFCLFFIGNDGLSSKQVGSQARSWVTLRLAWIQPDPTWFHKHQCGSRTERVNSFNIIPIRKSFRQVAAWCSVKMMQKAPVNSLIFKSRIRHQIWKKAFLYLNHKPFAIDKILLYWTQHLYENFTYSIF